MVYYYWLLLYLKVLEACCKVKTSGYLWLQTTERVPGKLTDFLMRLTVLQRRVAVRPTETFTSGEPGRSMKGFRCRPGVWGGFPVKQKSSIPGRIKYIVEMSFLMKCRLWFIAGLHAIFEFEWLPRMYDGDVSLKTSFTWASFRQGISDVKQ